MEPPFLLALSLEGVARLPFVREIQLKPRLLPRRIFLGENFYCRQRSLLVIHAQVRSDEFAGHSSEPQISRRS